MKVYYSVIAQYEKGGKWCIEFGDYDKQVAADEMETIRESGQCHKVKLMVSGASQSAVNAELAKINLKG
jgi:hypothetical protein